MTVETASTEGTVTALLALFVGSAHAQMDRTVFGLELGSPLSIHECEMKKPYGKVYGYSYKDASTSFVQAHFSCWAGQLCKSLMITKQDD